MTGYTKLVLVAVVVATFAVGSFAGTLHFSEAAVNLEDAASLSQNNTFSGIQNKFPKGIYIGEQGTGGVTYFNGTIANLTTNEDGNGIPVTVGDDLRVDGQIWRGESAGGGDDMPVKIDDDLEVSGNITGGGAILQSEEKPSNTPTTYETTTADPDYDAPEAVYMTTDDSKLLIMFSATVASNPAGAAARIFIVVDDEVITNSIRRGVSYLEYYPYGLATQTIVEVDAGEHTIQGGFNTAEGSTSRMFNRSLDVLEIKN